MKRAFAFLFVFVLLGALVGGLAWFQFVRKPEMIRGFIAAAPKPVLGVAAEAAKTEKWVSRIQAIGTLRATQGVDVAPQVGGVLRQLFIDSGAIVKKGDRLAQLDDSVEQADLKANRATLVNTELALDRQRQLLATKAGTQANFDAARAARDAAAATVEKTQALIRQKSITAPFDGRLGLRNVDLGQYVAPGASLVTLQQLDPILVEFPLPEQEISRLRQGVPIQITVDAWPGVTFEGKIASIDARISATTRNILVRAEIPNPGSKLLPGMFANVDVLIGQPAEVVTVPRTAINYSLYGDTVFIVKAAEKPAGKDGESMVVERRAVKAGETQRDRVSIREGVKAGEQVVTAGQIKLQPGMAVKVVAEGSIASPQPLPNE